MVSEIIIIFILIIIIIMFVIIIIITIIIIILLLLLLLLQAYCFAGDTFLEQDQCGKAIRAVRESDKCSYNDTCIFVVVVLAASLLYLYLSFPPSGNFFVNSCFKKLRPQEHHHLI